MKKLLLLFVTIQLSVVANAYDFTENGIYFNLKSDGSLEVTGLASWTTRADILSDVTINGRTYRVTSIGAHAFEGRSDITYLSIPWSVTSIGEYAFIDCGSNLTVNIADPESWCQMQLGNEHSSPLSSAGKVLVHDIETTNIVIPEGVTSIGNFTFYQCRCIRSLTIPSSVTSIGSSAFEDCTGLTSLAFSEGLQSVGGSAFQGCTGLKTLTIPSTVNTISINAFANCSNITDVYCYAMNVPETHFDAFDATPTEKSTLYVPTNAVEVYKTSWPWSDFLNFIGIGSTPGDNNPKKRTIHVAIPGTLSEHISKDEMYQIEELTLTGGLNGSDFSLIRDMAGVTFKFNGSSGHEVYELSPTNGNLKSLDLAGAKILKGGNPYLIVDVAPGARSLTRTGSDYDYYTEDNNISSRLFYATNLETIIIPSSVISISPSAFEKCDMLNTLVVPDGNQIYDSRDNCNAIIESATNQLIAGCKNTYIPNNVTSIGPSAFHTCTNLNSITIPSGVISIGDNAFNSCYNLSSITIPNSVISIGDNAFSFCYGLSSIIIPNSVYSISYGAFYNCSNLTSVTIPNSVISIGISAFERCSSLASITIPNSVSYIGSSAFSGTAWYDNQPNGLIYAGKTAYKFKGEMPAKTHITIKDETLGISGNAFNGCSGMTSITIPNSVTYIGAYAFSGTAWYDNQPDGLVYAGKVAYQYKGKMPANTHITIKDGTLGISGSAFYTFYSTNLTSISIPNSVTSIGESAFYNCSSLASISIPNSVTFIGGAAFYHCNNLTVIVSEIEKIFRIEKSVFYSYDKDIYATATLIVPKGTKAAYQATEGWNKFANIFEVGDVNCDNKINNDDLNALVSYIMGKIPANFNAKVADLNNDGKVNVADVTILVKIIKNIQ